MGAEGASQCCGLFLATRSLARRLPLQGGVWFVLPSHPPLLPFLCLFLFPFSENLFSRLCPHPSETKAPLF